MSGYENWKPQVQLLENNATIIGSFNFPEKTRVSK